jgi:DNA polymerase III delta subunit
MADLQRIQAVVGPSVRLRDEYLAGLRAAWTGPITRLVEPDDVPRLVLELETPSLFGDSSLLLIRADLPWIRRHADVLARHVGQPVLAGGMILVGPELDNRMALAKALAKANALHVADVPDAKGAVAWLAGRLDAHPQGVDHARDIATALIEHLGLDADGLLGAIEVLAIYADTGPLTKAGAEALFAGTAERPIWDLTGAFFEGKAKRTIELFHASGGEPEPVLAALLSDLRRQIACSETPDDDVAGSWIGSKGNLFYARKRAKELGRPTLLRLFIGALQLQRQLRTSGTDGQLALEVFVLHAQKVLGRGGR